MQGFKSHTLYKYDLMWEMYATATRESKIVVSQVFS